MYMGGIEMKETILLFLKTAVSRLFSGVRLLIGAAIFVPFFAIILYANYTVDRAGTLQGDQYLRSVAEMELSGKDIVGFESFNDQQRDILKVVADQIDPMPKMIALGSSRILQLDKKAAAEKSFFNLGLTGGDTADVLGTFYLFDRIDKLPQKIMIGFDPWMMRGDAEAFDARSDKALYAEFLDKVLGQNVSYEKADTSQKWQSLYSLSYFQSNIDYLKSGRSVTGPSILTGNLLEQESDIKRGDGSVFYPKSFRERSQDEIDHDALVQCNGLLLRMENYDAVDKNMVKIYDRFFAYAATRGVELEIMLVPYHPMVYDHITENPENYGGFLQTEPALRKLAEKYGIAVYGSYNPHALEGVSESDFYDGLHCRTDCMGSILRQGELEVDSQWNAVVLTKTDEEVVKPKGKV